MYRGLITLSYLRRFALVFLSVLFISGVSRAEIKVVTSIKPIHSLTSIIMQGVGEPYLIVKGAGSPHSFSLKPSDAKGIANARVIFWIGKNLETFLEKPLHTLGAKAKIIEFTADKEIGFLPYRKGGAWAEHNHDSHKHEKHHHKHDRADTESRNINPHIWLDPQKAKEMVEIIMEVLYKFDDTQAHKRIYLKNATKLIARLDKLTAKLRKQLAPVKHKPFIVFHDAYQYFEQQFDLKAVGSLTLSPEIKPGAHRIKEIRDKIKKLNAVCVFSEPQFSPALVQVVTEGTKANAGTLDPLGAEIPPGPELYFKLMERNAKTLSACLSKNS